jgi:hypothetical protein
MFYVARGVTAPSRFPPRSATVVRSWMVAAAKAVAAGLPRAAPHLRRPVFGAEISAS